MRSPRGATSKNSPWREGEVRLRAGEECDSAARQKRSQQASGSVRWEVNCTDWRLALVGGLVGRR